MSKIDFKIGIGKYNNDINWPFGNSELPNRHVLSLGLSGQGKTYAFQNMLLEATKNGISSLVFDYSDSYTNDKLDKRFIELQKDKLNQRYVYLQGVDIDPFQKHEIVIDSQRFQERDTDVSDRVCDILAYTLPLTPKQRSDVYRACMRGFNGNYGSLEQNEYLVDLEFDDSGKITMNLNAVRYFLSLNETDSANAALGKLTSLADKNIFRKTDNFDWGELIYSEGTVTVIQLSKFSKQMQKLITEFLLYDLWFYTNLNGCESKPFIIVLDECQNLSYRSTSPASIILTEGRKFGWSAWFATQFLGGLFEKDAINRLQQAALHINFKSTPNENKRVAKELGDVKWQDILDRLGKGQCVCKCYVEHINGSLLAPRPVIVDIPRL